MATITFCGESFIVDHAVKGSDYVHGYDANGNLVVSFDGVSDFSSVVYDGEYMEPDNCLPEACNDVKYCGGKLKTRGGANVSAMTLLWENASPSSTYPSFTPLPLDLSAYTAILVWYRTYKDDENYVSQIVPVGVGSGTSNDNRKQVTDCQAAGNNKWTHRYCFASTTEVTFGTGGHRTAVGNNWTVDSTYMIPVRIYGIQ